MSFKSILKPENSIVSGIATAGAVWSIYQLDLGSVAEVHLTEANNQALESSRKKAGYTSFLFVSAISLLTKDANIAFLGFATVIAMEIHYRHAIMVNPATNTVQSPNEQVYQQASNVVPLQVQGSSYDDASGW